MSVLMFLAASRRKQQSFSQTFTSNGVFPIPAGVFSINLSGRGARGTDAGFIDVPAYQKTFRQVAYDKNGGVSEAEGNLGTFNGSVPADYCDPVFVYPPESSLAYSTTCYSHSDASYTVESPAKTGASSTVSGSNFTTRTFPGSTGNVTPPTTTFSNLAVTPAASLNVVVPATGTVTISWVK